MIVYLITEGLAFYLFTDFSSQAPQMPLFCYLPCFLTIRRVDKLERLP